MEYNNLPRVSIIVLVFGVEKYIEKVSRSLFEQTLDDIEYIFVNDCTEDDSMQILNRVISEYPQRSSQIVIETMPENSGQAAARKRGIELAKGQFIIHCDSDDWVENEMYEQLWNAAVDFGLDIVVCDMLIESNDGHNSIVYKATCPGKDFIERLLLGEIPGSLCNKLIRREIVHSKKILSPTNNMCEDVSLSIQYAVLAEKIGYLEIPFYHYMIHSGSITYSKDYESQIKKAIDFYENVKLVVAMMKAEGFYRRYRPFLIRMCLSVKNTLLGAIPYYNCRAMYVKLFRKYNCRILISRHISVKEKLMFIITCLGLYPLYYRRSINRIK